MEVLQRVRPALALAVLALALGAQPALASNGKISGTITDASGEPLIGARVSTEVGGFRLGTVTDDEGRYFILNVPPGRYAVEAGHVGHQTVQKTDVLVRLDLTTTVDFSLATEAIQGPVVVVLAERPPVEKSLTSTRQTIDPSEITNTMPVSDLQDLINTTPSSFRGFIRGGRKADTKVLLDGIDVSDSYFRAGEGFGVYSPYTATHRSVGGEFTSVGVNASSVQSLDVISGTFNAEYDAATAGIVNVVSREGGEELETHVFYRTGPGTKNVGPDVYNDLDKYLAERDELANADDEAQKAKAAYYTFDESTIDEIGYGDALRHELELSVGGPLTSRGNFFFTGRFLNDNGNFSNALNRSARLSLKATHRATDALKVTANVSVDDGGRLGGWTNRDFNGRFKFYPQGAIGNKKLGLLAYLGLTHTVSERTIIDVKLSQLNRTSEFGFSDDDGDGVSTLDEGGDFIRIDSAEESELYLGVGGSAVDADGNFTFFTSDPGNERFFTLGFSNNQYRFGQPGFYYEELKRNVTQLKADLTHQWNFNHQLKTGLLYRRHTLDQYQQRTQVKVIYDPNFPFETTAYTLNPVETALYVQDKIEYEGVIVNAGVRLDIFNPGAQVLADFFNPSMQDTLANGQITRRARLGDDADTKMFLQPRLGISHPISETAAMYYSWGRFYTPPPFSHLYDEYGTFANPSLPNVRDVNADPPEATAYEMGLQWGFHPDYLVDVTAYYRDIENYGRIGYAINPDPAAGAGFGSYTFTTSFGYADARGIEVSLFRRPGKMVSGRLNYAFSYIKASGGAGRLTPFPDKTSYAYAAGDTEVPLEDRQTFNTVERNVQGGNNSLTTGFDRAHQLSLSLQAHLPGGVDLSLIQSLETGFLYRLTQTSEDPRERATERGPANASTDVRFTRGVELMGTRAGVFLEVTNLLNRENVLAYDNSTIPSQVLWEEDQDPTGELNRAFSGQSIPLYGPPRQIGLGVSLDF